jgi:pyridoxine 5-phosphate synthase
MPRLGVNIDHVATIRQARGGKEPDPVWAAVLCELGGADGITVHLREDRRHIQDRDLRLLRETVKTRLNLELALDPQVVAIALEVRPDQVTFVPERRAELTTEGGLDVAGMAAPLTPFVAALSEAGIRVSLFIDPDRAQVEAARAVGAPVIELHTGAYCEAEGEGRLRELQRIAEAAALAETLGLECHAGHGLAFDTAGAVAAIPTIVEFNIGHFLIGEAIFTGLADAIRRMRAAMAAGRAAATAAKTI